MYVCVCVYVYDILVLQLPKIDWSAYSVTIPAESLKPPTRKTSNKPMDSSSDSVVLVRGRLFDDSKPETFNQVCVTHRLLEMYVLSTCAEIQGMDKIIETLDIIGIKQFVLAALKEL